jgi:hypothetical protein
LQNNQKIRQFALAVTICVKELMKRILALLILVFSTIAFANPTYLVDIPINCETIESELNNIAAPAGFKISPLEAHKIAMKTSNIVKPCASKLEQVIYHDSEYYYFTNKVLVSKKMGFKNKAVKVNGITGEASSGFDNP